MVFGFAAFEIAWMKSCFSLMEEDSPGKSLFSKCLIYTTIANIS